MSAFGFREVLVAYALGAVACFVIGALVRRYNGKGDANLDRTETLFIFLSILLWPLTLILLFIGAILFIFQELIARRIQELIAGRKGVKAWLQLDANLDKLLIAANQWRFADEFSARANAENKIEAHLHEHASLEETFRATGTGPELREFGLLTKWYYRPISEIASGQSNNNNPDNIFILDYQLSLLDDGTSVLLVGKSTLELLLLDQRPAPEPSAYRSRHTASTCVEHNSPFGGDGWQSLFTSDFKREIKLVDKNLQGRVLAAIMEILEQPTTIKGDTVKPLRDDMKGMWRYRIGDYRLVYLPKPDDKKIVFIDFGGRGKVYQ